MGNITSTLSEEKKETKTTFGQVIDYIATYYILTMDFESLRKLNDKEYCDNLIILTSDIIERYFTDVEITYLSQRTKNGVEVNEMDKDKVIFLSKPELEKMNVSNAVKKKRICIGISKFYIKVAHVFASIVTTINPVYVYKDATGAVIKKKLFEKSQIPPNVERKLYKLGICSNRINSLKRGQDSDTDAVKNIHPNVCDINIGVNGQTKSLQDEPGIPELMDLYFDKYDYASGKFIGMTDQTKREFEYDLKNFYKIFTGNEAMPSTIKSFSDIKLKDYHKLDSCSGKDAILRKNIQLNKMLNEDKLKKKLFDDYAENLKQMIKSTNKSQDELLKIINELFTYVIDPQTQKKRIIVHPKLSEGSLQEIVIKTRKIIIGLYLKCETDYSTGIKLYQAIVEKQIKDTTIRQLHVLEKETENLVNMESNPPVNQSAMPLPFTPVASSIPTIDQSALPLPFTPVASSIPPVNQIAMPLPFTPVASSIPTFTPISPPLTKTFPETQYQTPSVQKELEKPDIIPQSLEKQEFYYNK